MPGLRSMMHYIHHWISSASPSMEWFWAVGGLLMIIPIILVFLFHPYETKTKELEVIEAQR